MPQTYFDFDKLKEDTLKLSKVAHIRGRLQIQGGDPIGSPFLPQLLEHIVDIGLCDEIVIATNGVRPLSDPEIAAIKKANVLVRVSNYAVVNKSVTKMVAQCVEHNIWHMVYNFATQNGQWLELGGVDTQEMSETQAQSNFKSCPFQVCLTLEDGLLARCSRGTTAHIAQQFAPNPGDHLLVREIEDIEELRRKMFDYTQNPKAMKACAFCKGGNTGLVEAGAQFTKSEISDLLMRVR